MPDLFLRASAARRLPAQALPTSPTARNTRREFRCPLGLAARLDAAADALAVDRPTLIRTALDDFLSHLEVQQ